MQLHQADIGLRKITARSLRDYTIFLCILKLEWYNSKGFSENVLFPKYSCYICIFMKTFFYLSILLVFITGCSKDSVTDIYAKPEGCDSIAFTYSRDIAPIIQVNCNLPACHATGGDGSYDYSNYAVLADRIRNNRLEDRLHLPIEDPLHMPVGIRMNPCEKYKLLTWIAQGFPNN